MATPSSITLFKLFLSTYVTLIFILSFCLENGHAFEKTLDAKSNFHSVHISSILQPSACNPTSSKGPNGKVTLKLVQRHGPCHEEQQSNEPTLAEILTQDQSRVNSIQARHALHSKTNRIRDSKVTLPAKSGISLGTTNYVVTIGLGTPKKDYALVFDTGSDLTWTQCEPCARFCHSQRDPIYNPGLSTTYSNISCTSAQCSQLSSATGHSPACSGSNCVYAIQYGDQSFSIGFLAKERLTLSPTDAIDNFYFGCGQNNRGLFGNTAGLLGLGRDPISIVSQTAQRYGKHFSYCLPTKSGSNGYLSFGKGAYSPSVKFTPFLSSQFKSFYFIDLLSITVGRQTLPISASVFQAAGTLIDSGTVITRLPPTAYSAMRTAFRQQMTKYKTAPAFSLLDTCYDLSKETRLHIPKISLSFSGNVRVDLRIPGILVAANASQVCLAFAGNSADTDAGIIGNTQQQTLQVVYDVAGGRLGFGAGGCS